jgi:hypothetical protein
VKQNPKGVGTGDFIDLPKPTTSARDGERGSALRSGACGRKRAVVAAAAQRVDVIRIFHSAACFQSIAIAKA